MIREYKIKDFRNKICNFKYAKCKECIFSTGIKCHGHGDFWAECKILIRILTLNENEKVIDEYNKINIKNKIDLWYSVINDNSKCKLYELINKLNSDENIYI